MTADLEGLQARRLERWAQTGATRIPDVDAGAALIERLGIVTLYPVSAEIPNLFHAYLGDPEAKTESTWDSPSGQVYTWRWSLGGSERAFYSTLVRGRPTWVHWPLLSSVLRLRGELRHPEELYVGGELSANAYRIAQALESAGGVLTTGQLRRKAGFPTGKEYRAAYLKAVDELDGRLLLAKVFPAGNDDMSHALVRVRYEEHVAEAERLSRDEALDRILMAYLPGATYALPGPLGKHLKIPEGEVRAALDRMVAADLAFAETIAGVKGTVYVWNDG